MNAYKKACEFDSIGFGLRKKQEGKIKNFGMSFHDTPELLDEILTAHPELDFVQLQINYIDWENPGIQSRRCHEVARKHGEPIIVMEPCKGGSLALVPEKAEQLMKAFNPAASVPSWAIRFASSQEGVMMVLSGMNTLEQLLDNTSYMADFKPLSKEEYEIIGQVIEIINENTVIPCTTCRYCEKDCPKNIAIPDYFALYNSAKRAMSSNFSSQFVYYTNLLLSVETRENQDSKAHGGMFYEFCDEINSIEFKDAFPLIVNLFRSTIRDNLFLSKKMIDKILTDFMTKIPGFMKRRLGLAST